MTSKEKELLDGQDEGLTPGLSWNEALLATTRTLPLKISRSQIQQISPLSLAYIGDAIYELYVRMFYLLPMQQTKTYHCLVVEQVRAETQALHLRSLIPHLTPAELEIVRRGRNASSGRPKRVDPKIYQQATSLEALIGYLYLTDSQRLTELLQKLHLEK
ncbi:Mini-ribonuclease 3 [Umezakia ovalisporum]|uniref:Mini-ribonuclease 3 n=2 Tax=Umezakia ovalisporum TaxID=75695 RepID=A0AA43KG35_9CYAN|nr:ribonuclease III domain-containing protein [Umezakia ovalisporum]MDH6058015.1 ribonuclease III [Umezakia ovalisporum FSS-43]MDH6065172.1 ribonuclease III [Umezakia ovalisporum FSS-62]MDH6066935.1 ribonuclease III [Umezakia ovalisporum APH033B]MDH6072038.1 ribonuclease III [Umezakia ovalisporum CobakiLakeA]MDH6074171.1 ribonuclease III [Umezakia ovalisporum CS-1034]